MITPGDKRVPGTFRCEREHAPHPIEAGAVFCAFLLANWGLRRFLIEWWITRDSRRLVAELGGYLDGAARDG